MWQSLPLPPQISSILVICGVMGNTRRPVSLRVLCRILAVPRIVPGWWLQPQRLLSPLRPLMLSLPSLWYFSTFLCSFFLMLISFGGSDIYHCCFLILLFDHNNIQLISHHPIGLDLEVWQDLCSVITLRVVAHFDPGTSNPYSVQMFLKTMQATWLSLSKYA